MKFRDKLYNLIENISDAISNIVESVDNLKFWLPTIWEDRDFDYEFLFKIFYKKLQKMENYFNSKYISIKNASKYAKEIKIAKLLIERIIDDKYYDNALNFYKNVSIDPDIPIDMKKDNKTGLFRIIFKGTKYQRYMLDKVYEHTEYMKQQDIEYLFKYLNKNIQKWQN